MHLGEILDLDQFQKMMEKFYKATGIPFGIVSSCGEVLAGVGWKTACTDFHRKHPKTNARCQESDIAITHATTPGSYTIHQCKNGMVDAGIPIVIEEEYLATFFLGQFFFEEPDLEFFALQAETFGFDLSTYLTAIQECPVVSRAFFEDIMAYYVELVNFLTNTATQKLAHSRTVQKLKKSEAHLQQALSGSGAVLWEVNLQENSMQTTANWAPIIGWPINTPLPTDINYWLENVHPDDLDTIRKAYNDHASGKTDSFAADFRSRHFEHGEWVWIHTCGRIQERNQFGVPIRCSGTKFDITRQKEFEAAMIQAEKMVSLGSMAAGMAHELNNPLGAILQGCQNIERRLTTDLPANHKAAEASGCAMENIQAYAASRDVTRFIHGMQEAGSRAANIISAMLNFSQHDNTSKPQVSVNDIIESALGLASSDYNLHTHYDFRSIRILRHFSTEIPAIKAIPDELEQVFLNLFQNAAHALADIQAVSPTISIFTRMEKEHIVAEIADNGPGMPENVRRQIFEPFYTTKSPCCGSGLGLAVSWFIITRNHGGEIAVDSSPGNGTRFTLRFPLSAA